MDDTRQAVGDGYLAALDFGDERGNDSVGVLDFGDEYIDDSLEPSVIEVVGTDEPVEPADSETQAAISAQTEDARDEDDEISRTLATVTNPAETVSVTATMSGEIHKIELSPTVVATMTASELADEILVVANLARQQARAMQYASILESVHGANDDEAPGGLLENHLGLSSPEQAAQAQAKVFAARYASDVG